MSSILVQFRLNPEDPERPYDEDAKKILEKHRRRGEADRDILTSGLLALDGTNIPPTKDAAVRKLIRLADQLEDMIDKLNAVDRSPAVYTGGPNAGEPVNFGFMDTIMNGLQSKAHDEEE